MEGNLLIENIVYLAKTEVENNNKSQGENVDRGLLKMNEKRYYNHKLNFKDS